MFSINKIKKKFEPHSEEKEETLQAHTKKPKAAWGENHKQSVYPKDPIAPPLSRYFSPTFFPLPEPKISENTSEPEKAPRSMLLSTIREDPIIKHHNHSSASVPPDQFSITVTPPKIVAENTTVSTPEIENIDAQDKSESANSIQTYLSETQTPDFCCLLL